MRIKLERRDIFHDCLPVDHQRLDYLRKSAAQLTGYAETRGEWLPSTEALLDNRLGELKGRRLLHVMDLGPGHGFHLGQIGKGSKIRIYAFGPHKPAQAPANVIHIPHYLEETVLPEALDIIQSRWGAIHHSANKAVALENALNSLRPGGHLVLHHQELSGLPVELEHNRKGYKAELETDLRQCIQQYRKAHWTHVKEMEDHDAFYLAYHVLQEIRRQGFQVPTDDQLARAIAHGGDIVIRRGKAKADLKAFYEYPNYKFNPVPIYL